VPFIACCIGIGCWALCFSGIAWPTEKNSAYEIELFDLTETRLLHSVPASPGNTFTLTYIHSVEKTPVYEVYTFDGCGHIYLLETTVESCGYGLPEVEEGDRYYFHQRSLTITDIYRKIDPLILRVSFLNEMRLSFDHNNAINLPEITSRGNRVEIRVRVYSSLK